MQVPSGPVFALSALATESRPAPAEASALVVTDAGLVVTYNGTSVQFQLSPEQMRAVATVMHALSTMLGADETAMREMLLRAGTVASADA